MQTVFVTFFFHHNLLLVALAAVVCALSTFAGVTLLHHARRTEGPMQLAWIGIAAISVGFGIWATHFIAMLAYSPGIPSGYNIILTILSLFAAILLTGAGLLIASGNRFPARRWIGGATVAAASRQCTTPEWQLSRSPDGSSGTRFSLSLPSCWGRRSEQPHCQPVCATGR